MLHFRVLCVMPAMNRVVDPFTNSLKYVEKWLHVPGINSTLRKISMKFLHLVGLFPTAKTEMLRFESSGSMKMFLGVVVVWLYFLQDAECRTKGLSNMRHWIRPGKWPSIHGKSYRLNSSYAVVGLSANLGVGFGWAGSFALRLF